MVTKDDFSQLITAIEDLHDKTGSIITGFGHDPLSGSIAEDELQSCDRHEYLLCAYSQGSILIEVAADHLISFTRSVTEPVLTIAPWTSVRSLLEASAVSAWILDPDIKACERVQRSFSFRFEGLNQQVKYARSVGKEADLTRAQKRVKEIEVKANELGYESLHNKHKQGKFIGIDPIMPSYTDLIGSMLDEEKIYRLLSAMIHGHPWALQRLGFNKVEKEGLQYLEKGLQPVFVIFLCDQAIRAFHKTIRSKCRLFGWDVDELSRLFDNMQQQLGVLCLGLNYPLLGEKRPSV